MSSDNPNKALRLFWFKFEKLQKPSAISLGCGVTAYSYEDAILLLRQLVFKPNEALPITESIADIDISTLEQNHVLPNLGNVLIRGIWFPQGYDVRQEDEGLDERWVRARARMRRYIDAVFWQDIGMAPTESDHYVGWILDMIVKEEYLAALNSTMSDKK